MAELYNFARGYNFIVYFDGIQAAFAQVSGMTRKVELERISEGGVNNRGYSLAAPFRGDLVLNFERGVMAADRRTALFKPGQRLKEGITICVSTEDGEKSKEYTCIGCVIRSISYSSLDATKSAVFVEQMEVLYEAMLEEQH
jgi:phage tail-like protein